MAEATAAMGSRRKTSQPLSRRPLRSRPASRYRRYRIEPLAQRRLGVGSLLDGDGHDRRARQDGAALDEDELAGHGHEGADVRHLLLVEAGQRFEVGPGEVAQRHLEDVQLALLDEPQQQTQRALVALHADVCGAIGMRGVGEATLVSPRTGWRSGGSTAMPTSRASAPGGRCVSVIGRALHRRRQDASSASRSATPASGSTGSAWWRMSSAVRSQQPAVQGEASGVVGVMAQPLEGRAEPGQAGEGVQHAAHRSALRATMRRDAAGARPGPLEQSCSSAASSSSGSS